MFWITLKEDNRLRVSERDIQRFQFLAVVLASGDGGTADGTGGILDPSLGAASANASEA